MSASVPVSVFPSLYLKLILWSTEATELIILPGLLRPSREGALCLHPLERAPGAYVKQCKLCVNCFIGALRKTSKISLFLSHFLIVNSGPPGSGPLKDPNTSVLILRQD